MLVKLRGKGKKKEERDRIKSLAFHSYHIIDSLPFWLFAFSHTGNDYQKKVQYSAVMMQVPTRAQCYSVFKLIAPPHAAVLLLTILALMPAISNAVGQGTFIVILYLHLFFYPSGPVGEHVERVFIHLTTCAVGLAITTLFVCITVWIDGDDNQAPYTTRGSRALGACILGLWCFVGGFCESRFPRIKVAMRIFLFSSIWTITTGASQITSTIFTEQFYPAALAAGVSLLSSLMLFPHSAQDDFVLLLARIYNVQKILLRQTINDFFADAIPHQARKPSSELIKLRKELLETTTRLKQSFESAGLEPHFARIAIVEAKPLVASVKRTKGWITCGMGLGTREGQENEIETPSTNREKSNVEAKETRDVHEEKLMKTVQPCISRLLDVLEASIGVVLASVELTMNGGTPKKVNVDERWSILYQVDSIDETTKPGLKVARQRQQMLEAVETFKGDLALVLKHLADSATLQKNLKGADNKATTFEHSVGVVNGSGLFRSDLYDVAFLMVSLMEISKEVLGDLATCRTIMAHWHAHERKRLWLPSVGFSTWIRTKLSRESQTGFVFHNDELDAIRRELLVFSENDKKQRVDEKVVKPGFSFIAWAHQSKTIRWRIKISKVLAYLKHSVHVQYGLKLAAGAVLLSMPAWISEARFWFQSERGVWLIVTYIWVLETSTGATIRISIYRALATILSVVWAIIAWYICNHGNRYGIAVFIILPEVPASYFILFTRHAQSFGFVFAFTQSIILLYHYTPAGAHDSTSVVHLGLVRGYQILLGIVAAFLVNIFIWPLHARVFLLRTISRVTAQCSTEYLSLARQMLNHGIVVGPETSKKFGKLEDNIEIELMACREYLEIMHVELSLIPKPVNTLSLIIKTLQRIADLLVLLRKCREVALRIIQKESCFNVLNLRKELVSSLLLSFWIIGQSLVTKEPLPQFLPSCRDALGDLTEAMKEKIEYNGLQVRITHGQESGQESAGSGNLTPPLGSIFTSSRRRNRNNLGSGQSTPRQRKVIDYSYFFVFAEHTLLSEIIFEVEKLLFLTKMLVGESSFIDSQYLPRHDYFDATNADIQDLNVFRNSVSEHGIDGKRLLSQLDARLRAAKSEAAVVRAISQDEG